VRKEEPAPFYVSPGDAPAKQELLKAALRLFVRDGLCETSIRAIAAEAGYSNPAIFKHFDTKEALALHLFERCYRRLSSELSSALDPVRPFPANLHAVVERFAGLLDENSDAFLYVQDTLRLFWPKVAPALRRYSLIGLLKRLVQAGVREGEVASGVSEDLLVAAMAGFLSQFARALYFGELSGDAKHWVPAIEQTLRRMVRP